MAKLLRDVKVFSPKTLIWKEKGRPFLPRPGRRQMREFYTDRKLASSTLANHAASLIYPAKFLNREHAVTLYRDVKVVSQLRGACNAFQRQARAAQPTQEDLVNANKWLPWDEVIHCVDMQTERFDMARSQSAKARESRNLLSIALFVLIPPSRGQEIRTLRIAPSGDREHVQGLNSLVLNSDGTLMFRFEDYKTYGSHGVDVTNLPTDKGKPFSGPAFSTHMKSVFYHLTGVSVNLHLLRSSFVTYCYGDSQFTDAMKDSLASALRHTRKQAQLTYDRRNSSEKKSLAVSLASELAENTIESLSAQPSDRNSGLDKGSWVALTVEGSTLANPNILLARIQNLMPGRKASLLWFKATAEKGLYAFHYDEASWIESLDALVPVQVKEIKNSPGLYKLTTSLKKNTQGGLREQLITYCEGLWIVI
ncbi:predicted protein [Nematostella vectensis]|uniref:Uncharacterized protein n=1 Tax=Nematostella vectensis TaxID=45351 RepID=A7T7H4_NEMVE|nr:predicted protein [Nematostella vectensis]|eukprot:XP_001620177.1 hypothetical protein NEMVEDRAFT_v1g223370 [Nematostella vectensis]